MGTARTESMSLRRYAILCFGVFLVVGVHLHSQQNASQNAPHIGYVFPAGGRQGDTIEVEVGGQFLDKAGAAYITGDGIQATIVDFVQPLPPNQMTALRDQMDELQKKGKDAEILKEINSIRAKLAASQNLRANPAISQRARFQMTLAPDAGTGMRELRFRTPSGLSNPLVFCVGQLPEYREKNPKTGTADTVTEVSLPAVINGQLIPGSVGRYRTMGRQFQTYLPGDVDRYKFTARKGQRLVAIVSARELIPYLPDAVPGWIQAVLTLSDSSGKEVAYSDDFSFHPDPVLYYEIPKDDDYVLEIKDALYRGRDDFVYRITIGEFPFLTSIFPLGGRTGTHIAVQTSGWNLTESKMTMDAGRLAPGLYSIRAGTSGPTSNAMPFMVGTLPECLEKEPNNSQKNSQLIKLPIIINGRVDSPGDVDVFNFKGRSGDTIAVEVYARRLDSPLDSVIRLADAKNHQLAFNDDFVDKGSGLETHHADSYFLTTLPADGTYSISLGDAQHKGGPEYGYRLRISAPEPDFDLRIVPSAVNSLMGPNAPITVYALRKDGFSGEIALSLKAAPAGVALSSAKVPAGLDKVQLTMSIPAAVAQQPAKIILEGRAKIEGHEIARLAVPADDRMQAFAYRHLVPSTELWVGTAGRGATQQALKILDSLPLKIPSGGTIRVRLTLPSFRTMEKVQFELIEPPDGITIAESSLNGQEAGFVLRTDAAKAKPGVFGNLIVTVSGQRTPAAKEQPVAPQRQRVPMGTLPALPFEIVKP
jgi:hypothetical protein